MKTSSKILSTSVEFTVEFNKDDLEPARLTALERLARNIKVPGFRNGKAPANVVEQHVDPNDLATQTLDVLVRRTIPTLFDKAKLMPVSVPHVDVKKYVPGEMAEITIVADIMPEVTLGDYKKLKAKFVAPAIADKDVEDVLGRIAESYAETKVVKRAAAKGDEVIIDFVGKKDGKEFEGGSAKDYHLELGSGKFIPGFEEGIVGHASGDKFDINLSFPKNYGVADLAGKPVVFEVLVKQVNEVIKPAVDDELAKKTGAFATLSELKADIRTNLEARANQEADSKYKDDLLTELVNNSKTEAPLSLVDEQFQHIKDDMLRNLQSHGMTIEQYLERNKQKVEDWENEVRAAAKHRVISSLVAQKLSDVLGIEISDAEAEKQVAEMREVYQKDKSAMEQLDDPQVQASIRNRMRIDRTMEELAKLNRPAKTEKAKADKSEEKATKAAKSDKTDKAAKTKTTKKSK